MTIQELFYYTDEQFPNQYTKQLKLQWVNQVEKDIHDYLTHFHEGLTFTPHVDVDEELLIDEPDVYALYISARVDFANGEYARYNNKAAMYHAFLSEWQGKYIRNNKPLNKGYIKL